MRDTNWTRKHMKGIRNNHEHRTTGYEFETRTQSGIRIQYEPSILRVNWTRGRTYICQFNTKTRMDDWIGNQNEHSRTQHDLTWPVLYIFILLLLLQPIPFYPYSSNVFSNRPWWSLTAEVKRRHTANGPPIMIMMTMFTFIYSIKYISKVKNAINYQIKKPACPNADKRKQKDSSKFCTR